MILLSLLACNDQFWLRTDGADLRVQVDGNVDSGTILLLLHGGPQGDGFTYNQGLASDLIEEEFGVAYFDQRGQGASRGAVGTPSIQQVADDTAALVRALKARYGADTEVWLYGHSWGGMLGTATILDTDIQPELAGWIDADGSHDYPLNDIYTLEMFVEVGTAEIEAGSDYSAEWGDIVDRAQTVLDRGEVREDDSYWMNSTAFEVEDYLDQVVYEEPLALGTMIRDWTFRPVSQITMKLPGAMAASALNTEAYETSYTDRLGEIEIPSLFLYGAYDFVTPSQLGQDAFDRVSGTATFSVLDGSGHSSMMNQPEAYAEEIITFVNEN